MGRKGTGRKEAEEIAKKSEKCFYDLSNFRIVLDFLPANIRQSDWKNNILTQIFRLPNFNYYNFAQDFGAKTVFSLLLSIILFVACYATLQSALSVRPSVRPSVHLSVFLSVCLSVCPSIHPSVRLSVRPSVRPSVTLYFFWVFAVFGLTAPAQKIKWPQIRPLPTHTRLG